MANVSIDGSVLEGGGQILRNSVSLSALLNTPISITKIRTGRKPPGLRNQHRVGIEAAAGICSGHVQGAKNGSTAIDFHPSSTKIPCHVTADAVTAGSTALLLQTALPMLLFAPVPPEEALPLEPSTLVLRGGTNASQAPQIEYTQHILVPFLKRHFGVDSRLEISLNKRGYYPKGGGELIPSRIEPLKPIQLSNEQGRVIRIGGLSHVGRLPASLATEMAGCALKRLARAGFRSSTIDSVESRQEMVIPIEIQTKREGNDDCLGAGSGIVLWAELEGGGMIGGSALGRKNVLPAQVGEAAADELIKGLKEGGCVDEHLQDQIIVFMALAAGRSSVLTGPISLHTRTAIWLAEKLTEAKFSVVEQPSGQCVISCEGIAYQRTSA
ncbi:RNA 3'-terminal phosphate cyclase [Pleurotus eryngii]|uniref:RNA 3'-terminal-phosphate cyclase (ATP) n=1 Tax=Pleurotus eryngii TaxID=5323 RepID=A0A9P5ZQU3_PLEER|nr:RNA 3'-terminal phosphate cyclase [Pleurotus eryngii]